MATQDKEKIKELTDNLKNLQNASLFVGKHLEKRDNKDVVKDCIATVKSLVAARMNRFIENIDGLQQLDSNSLIL